MNGANWLQAGGLIYRVTGGTFSKTTDEIRVSMICGSRDPKDIDKFATALLTLIRESDDNFLPQKPVLWQYRWLNPAGDDVAPSATDWRELKRASYSHTLQGTIDEIKAYRYKDKPCYEVRALGVIK